MNAYEKTSITIAVITLAFGLIVHNARISELENQIKLVNPCKIITVMTPDGYQTTACAQQ